MQHIGIEDTIHWNTDTACWVNVTYDGEVADVSADFTIEPTEQGWSVRRQAVRPGSPVT